MPVKIERERRFLLKKFPDLSKCNFKLHKVQQGYFVSNDQELRVRGFSYSNGSRFTLTSKDGFGLERKEQECDIPMEAFQMLLPLCGDRVIRKDIYEILEGDTGHWEVHLFHGKHDGLIIAEYEFKDDADTGMLNIIEPIALVLDREITGSKELSNSELSRNPLPKNDKDNNTCPVCGKEAELVARCMRRHSVCPDGHEWHMCLVHNVKVLGDSNLPYNQCSCPQPQAKEMTEQQ